MQKKLLATEAETHTTLVLSSVITYHYHYYLPISVHNWNSDIIQMTMFLTEKKKIYQPPFVNRCGHVTKFKSKK